MRRHRNKAFGGETYTNSLYLDADKIVVRTYKSSSAGMDGEF